MGGRWMYKEWRGKEGSWCLFSRATYTSVSLSHKEQRKTAKHFLICLLMAVAQIKSCWFVQATMANENARGGHATEGRLLVQSGPSWPVNASRATSQWIINLSASISALESLPNTKAKCPPCSEAALLRVCGYFNKNEPFSSPGGRLTRCYEPEGQ